MNSAEVVFPGVDVVLEQDEEYFVLRGAVDDKIQFHDYEKIYRTPGLYEMIFHEKLKCKSPQVISDILYKNVDREGANANLLKILDFGAGNGMVAEQLQKENPELVVGVDIIEAAKEAAMRDRPQFYNEYFVTDMGKPDQEVMDKLKTYDLNTVVSVAALGFDHIPPDSFINAFNLVEENGWIAFNLRDKFLTKQDESGFRETIDWISEDHIEILDEETYVHRLSLNGNPIHYTAMVGRKLSEIKM